MKPKLVLLITGQKSRLELKSKIKYIIDPLLHNYDILVILSLSNTSFFTNKHKYSHINLLNSEPVTLLSNISHFENNIIYPNLPINHDIVSMYDKGHLGSSFRLQRANNHIRQYYSLSTNLEFIRRFNPDILIKIRDDAMLSTPLHLDKILDLMKSSTNSKTIVTPSNFSWGGINDKFAIVSNHAIESFLISPFHSYNSFTTKNTNAKFRNPEQFLQHVYHTHGISLLVTDININILGTTS